MISSPSSSSSTAVKRRRGFGASTGFESTSDQDWYIRLPLAYYSRRVAYAYVCLFCTDPHVDLFLCMI